jgi:F-type H+-transporting ATPase subunit b
MSLMEIDPGVILWTLIIFIVLVILLRKLAWKPILNMLDAREKRIREAVEKADRVQADADKALEEQKKLSEQQRQEAAEFMAQAKEDAKRTGAEMVEKARREAQEATERARRQIEEERTKAVESVRSHAVELALDAAAHLLSKKLDDATNRAIVSDYIDKLPDNLKQRH